MSANTDDIRRCRGTAAVAEHTPHRPVGRLLAPSSDCSKGSPTNARPRRPTPRPWQRRWTDEPGRRNAAAVGQILTAAAGIPIVP